MSGRAYVWKTILLSVSNFICAIGVALLIMGQMGADPLSVWLDGFAKTANISLKMSSMYTNLTLLSLALLFGRKYIHIGTFIGAIGFSFFLGMVEPVLATVLGQHPSFAVRVGITAVSVLIVAISCGLTVSLRLGFGTTDCLLFSVYEKTKIPYRYSRIFIDAFYLTVGFLFGGVLGFGTIASMLLTGPLVEVFAKFFDNTLLKQLGLQDERNQFRKESQPKKAYQESVQL